MSEIATKQVEDIAYQAAKLQSAAERVTFVKAACDGDAALQSAVEQMVAECDSMDRFLEQSRPTLDCDSEIVRHFADATDSSAGAAATFNVDALLGSQIGPYKLLQRIGEGGCGAVYMAEQDHPVRRRVAIKVIKLGMDTQKIVARFEAERQALALMDHPNIARVLDAGATETGRPYFVMELVRGVKITNYCDENRLGVRERLQLFIQVCHAVQHAHQKGIIHRDLKPSNILVTMLDGAPLPKVIDFGIAKATGNERLTDNTLFTAYEQFIGTPAYMSPEQAQMSAVDVDTRSDIYSLGVLLYELLAGKPPFDQADLLKEGFDEMRRTLSEREPQRPSTRLGSLRAEERTQTASSRQMEMSKLKSLVKGDLDWIVMKALEKDRQRRYQTANGFALDVQRYLSDEPVFARPPSRIYRLRKLVSRNRKTFAAIGAASVVLIAGFITSTWLFLKEREARQDAEQLRAEAVARARINRAALMINRQQIAEADELVDTIQVPMNEPSLEAAGVFRVLAEWNVSHGRWKAAADRYLKLAQANQLDQSNTSEEISRDLLGTGPALIVAGESNAYHQFVHDTLVRFSGTSDPVAAEQMIKSSLILPADDATLERLKPLVSLVEYSVAKSGPETDNLNYFVPWQSLALSLHEYRDGSFANAVSWGQKCLKYPNDRSARVAMAHIVLAMSYAKLNQPEMARSELALGRELVDGKLPNGPKKITDLGWTATGFWHDWVIAYLLLDEAKRLIG